MLFMFFYFQNKRLMTLGKLFNPFTWRRTQKLFGEMLSVAKKLEEVFAGASLLKRLIQ